MYRRQEGLIEKYSTGTLVRSFNNNDNGAMTQQLEFLFPALVSVYMHSSDYAFGSLALKTRLTLPNSL